MSSCRSPRRQTAKAMERIDMTEENPEQHSTPQIPKSKQLQNLRSQMRRLAWPALAWRIVMMIVIALIAVSVWRATTGHARSPLRFAPVISVAVAKVTREDLAQELVCDAELRPYQEIDLHSKVAGFLESITVDIGDRVQAGQLLATIEVPELTDDINRAMA